MTETRTRRHKLVVSEAMHVIRTVGSLVSLKRFSWVTILWCVVKVIRISAIFYNRCKGRVHTPCFHICPRAVWKAEIGGVLDQQRVHQTLLDIMAQQIFYQLFGIFVK